MKRRCLARIVLFSASLILATSPLPGQQILSVPGEVYLPAVKPARRFLKADVPSRWAGLPSPQTHFLPLVNRLDHEAPNAYGQIPIGVSQPLSGEILQAGAWTDLSDGRRVWRLNLRSSGASALRVRFSGFQTSGQVWVYGPGPDVEGPFTGAGPFGDGDFWTGSMEGDDLTIEYVTERGDTALMPPFHVESVTHLWEPAPGQRNEKRVAVTVSPPAREAAGCHLDFKCSPEWASAGASVAHIRYVSTDFRVYVCSGSLLNQLGSPKQPYFLTAAHCISSEFEARSAETYWSYESQNCNGAAPAGPAGFPSVVGSSLLVTGGFSDGDFSLIRLSRFPDAAVTLAGWTAAPVAPGQAATGVHHPAGSYKRIAFGTTDNALPEIVNGVLAPAPKYIRSWWTRGRTEGGSSGSPLFNAAQQIIGVLSYGPGLPPPMTVCDLSPAHDGYGRFSEFFPAIEPFLSGQPAPTISLSPTDLGFNGIVGGSIAPATAGFQIRTNAPSALSFSVTSAQPWIRIHPASGLVSATADATVQVAIDASAFTTAGTFHGFVTVRAGSAAPQTVRVRVDLTVVRSNVVVDAIPNPVYESVPNADGQRWFFELRLRETAGVVTTVSQLKINDVDTSASIVPWFGTGRIAPFGTLSVQLGTRGRASPPYEDIFDISGSDTATGLAWSRRIVVRFLPRRQQATPVLSILPAIVSQNSSSAECPWRHEVEVKETNGVGMQITRWVAGGHDLSAGIVDWFGSNRLAAKGALRTVLCWRNLRVPVTLTFEIAGRDDFGNQVSASAQAQFTGPPSQQISLSVTPARIEWTAPLGSRDTLESVLRLNLSSPAAAWTAGLTLEGSLREWLVAFPLSGAGPAGITLRANPLNLPSGVHRANLSIESPAASPSRIDVPIELSIRGASAGAPVFTAEGVVNAASFVPSLAPGMLFTIFGQNLAPGTMFAGEQPLPSTLLGTTVRVNGVLAPLYYVSPGQINAQLPYDVLPGSAIITVSAGGQIHAQTVVVQPLAPGLFTVDGQKPTPVFEGRAGDVLVAYVTGYGQVAPPIAAGHSPPPSTRLEDLPVPVAPVRVFVGGKQAEVLFRGIPPGVIGAIQINYVIPSGLPAGTHPIYVQIGSVRTNTGHLNILPD